MVLLKEEAASQNRKLRMNKGKAGGRRGRGLQVTHWVQLSSCLVQLAGTNLPNKLWDSLLSPSHVLLQHE